MKLLKIQPSFETFFLKFKIFLKQNINHFYPNLMVTLLVKFFFFFFLIWICLDIIQSLNIYIFVFFLNEIIIIIQCLRTKINHIKNT